MKNWAKSIDNVYLRLKTVKTADQPEFKKSNYGRIYKNTNFCLKSVGKVSPWWPGQCRSVGAGGARPGAALRFYWLALRGSYFMSHNLATLATPHSLLAAPGPGSRQEGLLSYRKYDWAGLGWPLANCLLQPCLPASPQRRKLILFTFKISINLCVEKFGGHFLSDKCVVLSL